MKLYGLIGFPLGHSFSKQYFTQKFAKENIQDCFFESFAIPSIDLFPELLLQNPTLKGLSVTIPYKEQVLKYVDTLSDEVKFIGATNSIKIENGKLKAYNTDIIGFEETFIQKLQPNHKKALVLGTGGASKAVQFVLRKLNIPFLLVTRSVKKEAGYISYEAIDKALLEEFTVIINCSPVGMFPNENECPKIPYELLNSMHYLYDLVYKPAKTLFLQKGEQAGATILNGEEMLRIQAEASWTIWNN